MRRTLIMLALAAPVALPATAAAQAQAPDDPAGAPVAKQPKIAGALPPSVTGFAVTPKALRPGSAAKVMFRIDGGRGPVRVRVDLLDADGDVAATLRGGRRKVGKLFTRRWVPDVAPGRYTARLSATDADGVTLMPSAKSRATVTVKAPVVRRPADAPATAPGASPVPTATPAPAPVVTPTPIPTAPVILPGGRFPVRGAYTFGGADARFGAGRPGHIHQGQDVVAAEGTPLVSPGPGFVYWRKVQPGGAGHYLVIRSDAGPDWVFMHLVAGSELVAKGDRVTQGQQIGQVGSTGASSGPHLHFELWPNGWYADGSKPIDPLPTLKAWAGQ